MGRIVIPNVDEDLKRRFKVWCINHNRTMKDSLVRFMSDAVVEDREGGVAWKESSDGLVALVEQAIQDYADEGDFDSWANLVEGVREAAMNAEWPDDKKGKR